jgi:hypothetical protein
VLSEALWHTAKGLLSSKQSERFIPKGNNMKAYKNLVKYTLAKGYTVSVFDGEEWAATQSTSYNEIIEAIESVEEAELHLHIRDAENTKRMAWVRVSAFGLEDEETVVDHTVNEFMDAWSAQYYS